MNETHVEWKKEGLCRFYPPQFFFPADASGVLAAERVCRQCPVRTDCLEYASANHEDHGVWGGTSERKRRRIAKRRRLEQAR